jgi:hypothetical protein
LLSVGGNLTIGSSAVIQSLGQPGGSGAGSSYPAAGAGSGGGVIDIQYAGTLSNTGTITESGGSGSGTHYGAASAGSGGAGATIGPTQVSA